MPEPNITPAFEEAAGQNALEEILSEFREKEPAVPAEEPVVPEEPHAEVSDSPETDAAIDSDMADVIAQAVAATFDDLTDSFPLEDELPEEPAELPEETLQTAELSEGTEVTPEEAPEQPLPEPDKEAPPKAKNDPSGKGPSRKASSKKAKKPVKVPKDAGPLHSGFVESFALMLSDIRARRREDLPSNQSSLKDAERKNSQTARLCSPFAPVRYVVLAVMLLTLMGRRYTWMQFGILGGETGWIMAVLFTILSIAASWHAALRAVKDMIYMRFSMESLLLVTTLLSLLEALLNRNTATLLPLLAIGWSFAGTADLMLIRGRLRALRTVLAGKTRTGVRVARQRDGMEYIGKAPAGTSGFVRRQEEIDSLHSGWSFYAIPLFLICLIVSAYLTAKTEGNYLNILVTLLTVSLPVSALLCCARPFELLSRVLGRSGAVSGWFGMKRLSGQKRMLIYDRDMFPKGSITHKGLKIYGNQTPRLLVSYGASLAFLADNGLTEPFTLLLRQVGGQTHHVSYFQVTEGGLSGQIHGVRVALGTYNYMQLIGLMPPKHASKNGLFIALNQEIAGVFAISYKAKSSAIPGFQRLVREQGLKPVAATKNLSVNPIYLRSWFQVPVGGVLCPKVESRWSLSKPSRVSGGTVCGYLFSDGISAYSRLVAGARKAYRFGMILTLVSILCSLILMIYTTVAISNGTPLPAETRLLLIQLVLFLLGEAAARFSIR